MTSIGSNPTEVDLRLLTRALSLEQKVRLLTGADFWSVHSEEAVSLRRIVLSDGPVGVRGETWDERDTSANVPSPTSLAATWDEERAHRIGSLLASEARRKGVDVLLAPTVNLHRSPYGGRHFECFSEDPLLTGRMGSAYVRGVQSGGVAATVKHFVANDSETERVTVNVRVDERALREIYLAPFETIVREADPWLVMASYNGVNGTTMSEHAMLDEVLKREWGFDGVVVSDWFGARSTEATGSGGLDLAMPGPDGPWGEQLVAAVREGRVPEPVVDEKVRRLLRLAARVGALEEFTHGHHAEELTQSTMATELRRAAAAGFVLVRNEGPVLPLDPATLGRVAVLGPNAADGRTLGGGSATVMPPYSVSPLEGLRAAFDGRDDVEVLHAGGVRASDRLASATTELLTDPDTGEPGLGVRFLDADGALLGQQHRNGGKFTWMDSYGPGIPLSSVATVEVRARLRATDAGRYRLGCSGVGRFRLTAGDEVLVDDELELPPGGDVVEAMVRPPESTGTVPLSAGQEVEVVLRYGTDPSMIATMFSFGLEPPARTDVDGIAHAVALAKSSNVAIVVVGTPEEAESEGFDRRTLALPGRQDELVRRVAAVNSRTVVVVNSGAPVLLPWVDEVAAVLLTWFPGQEFGNALADVLTGVVEPGGRLPVTWPADEKGPIPSTRPQDGELEYTESIHIGHRCWDRAGAEPAFCFGHGEGYTTWNYENIEVPARVREGDDVFVRVQVRNSGTREGREVVQAYCSRTTSVVDRPVRWLAGFAAIEAGPGEARTAELRLPARNFAHWESREQMWITEPGTFTLHIGSSSRALPLQAKIEVTS